MVHLGQYLKSLQRDSGTKTVTLVEMLFLYNLTKTYLERDLWRFT